MSESVTKQPRKLKLVERDWYLDNQSKNSDMTDDTEATPSQLQIAETSPKKPSMDVSISIQVERDEDGIQADEEDVNIIRSFPNTYNKSCRVTDEAMRQEMEKLMQITTSSIDKQLEVHIRNTWGKHIEECVLSEIDQKIANVLNKFRLWKVVSKLRENVFTYKCYECNIGWWDLSPFREHLNQHPDVTLSIEPVQYVCNIIAHRYRNNNVREVTIHGQCKLCLRTAEQHRAILTDSNYHCESCKQPFNSCAGVFAHEEKCSKFHKLLMKDNMLSDFTICNICNVNYITEQRYIDHLHLMHVVRSDVPVFYIQVRRCGKCGGNYISFYDHMCSLRKESVSCEYCSQTYAFAWQLTLHNDGAEEYQCDLCHAIIKRRCTDIKHMLSHSRHYCIVYKCKNCDLVFLNKCFTEEHTRLFHYAGTNKKKSNRYVSAVGPQKFLLKALGCSDAVRLPKKDNKISRINKPNDRPNIISDRKTSDKIKQTPKTAHTNIVTKENVNTYLAKPESSTGCSQIITRDNVKQFLARSFVESAPKSTNATNIVTRENVDNFLRGKPSYSARISIDSSDCEIIEDDSSRSDAGLDVDHDSGDGNLGRDHYDDHDFDEDQSAVDRLLESVTNKIKCKTRVIQKDTLVCKDIKRETTDESVVNHEPMNEDTCENISEATDESVVNHAQMNDDSCGNVSDVHNHNKINDISTDVLSNNESDKKDSVIDLGTKNILDEEVNYAPMNDDSCGNVSDVHIHNKINDISTDVLSNNKSDKKVLVNDLGTKNILLDEEVNYAPMNDDTCENISDVNNYNKINDIGTDILCNNESNKKDSVDDLETKNMLVNEETYEVNIKEEPVQYEEDYDNFAVEHEIVDIKDEIVEEQIETDKELVDEELSSILQMSRRMSTTDTNVNLSIVKEEIDIKEEEIEDDIVILNAREVGPEEFSKFEPEIHLKSDQEQHRECSTTDDVDMSNDQIELGECSTSRAEKVAKLIVKKLTLDPHRAVTEVTDKKQKIYRCKKCKFEGVHSEFREHRLTHKSKLRVNRLDSENTRFNAPWNTIECTKCPLPFKCPTLAKYVQHLVLNHSFEKDTCPICFKTLETNISMTLHFEGHIRRNFTKIQLITQTSDVFTVTSKQNGVFQCRQCRKRVNNKDFFNHFESHIELTQKGGFHHEVKSKNLKGSLPSHVVASVIEQVTSPREDHRGIPIKRCVLCLYTSSRVSDIKRHLIEHLLKDAIACHHEYMALRCQICHENFSKMHVYKQHMRDHAGLSLYKCELCNKSFSDSSNFAKHKKVHNLQSLQCSICHKKFHMELQYQKHMEIHETTDPLTCSQCPKVFYCESALNKHMRIHKKLKFPCITCEIRFDSLKEKWNHMWEVHKQRKLKADCPVCKKSYRKLSDVKRHLKIDHADIDVIYKPANVVTQGLSDDI